MANVEFILVSLSKLSSYIMILTLQKINTIVKKEKITEWLKSLEKNTYVIINHEDTLFFR
jgi:hypothetical protein